MAVTSAVSTAAIVRISVLCGVCISGFSLLTATPDATPCPSSLLLPSPPPHTHTITACLTYH